MRLPAVALRFTDSDTSLSFAEVWDGLSGPAEQIESETKSGDLVGIMLPTSSMFCVAFWPAWLRDGPLSPLIPTVRATGCTKYGRMRGQP